MITNGDMEKDSNWTSYCCGTSLVPKVNEQSLTEKYNGKASRHVVIVRGAKQWPGIQSALVSATVTGKTYRVNFWIKVVKGRVSSSMLRKGKGYASLHKGKVINKPDWTEYTFYYTEKTGENAWLCFSGSKGETEFYLDDVSVEEVLESEEGGESWL